MKKKSSMRGRKIGEREGKKKRAKKVQQDGRERSRRHKRLCLPWGKAGAPTKKKHTLLRDKNGKGGRVLYSKQKRLKIKEGIRPFL